MFTYGLGPLPFDILLIIRSIKSNYVRFNAFSTIIFQEKIGKVKVLKRQKLLIFFR